MGQGGDGELIGEGEKGTWKRNTLDQKTGAEDSIRRECRSGEKKKRKTVTFDYKG